MKINKKLTQVNVLQKDVSKITSDVHDNPNVIYEIQKYSDRVGYIISPELGEMVFEYLEEREMLEDHELIASLVLGRKEFRDGKGQNLDDVLTEIEKGE